MCQSKQVPIKSKVKFLTPERDAIREMRKGKDQESRGFESNASDSGPSGYGMRFVESLYELSLDDVSWLLFGYTTF